MDGYKKKSIKVDESFQKNENTKSRKWTGISQSPQKWTDHPTRIKIQFQRVDGYKLKKWTDHPNRIRNKVHKVDGSYIY